MSAPVSSSQGRLLWDLSTTARPERSVNAAVPVDLDSYSYCLPDRYIEALLWSGKGSRQEFPQPVETECLPGQLNWRSPRPDHIEDLFDKLFVDHVSRKPELLSELGLLEILGIREHNNFLNDYSWEEKKREAAIAKENLALLESYSLGSLSPEQQTSYKIFHYWLTIEVNMDKFFLYEYPVTQKSGVIFNLSKTFTLNHKLEVKEDFQTYLKRLLKIPTQLIQVQKFMLKQQEHGIVPPRFSIEKALNNLNIVLGLPLSDHPFHCYFKRRLERLDARENYLLGELDLVLEKVVLPAYRNFALFLSNYLEGLSTNHSLKALPEGEAYYAFCLQKKTTTEKTADEIFQLGLQEVRSIQIELRELLKSLGIEDEALTVGELIGRLKEDSSLFFPNTESGKQACVQTLQDILDRSRRDLSVYFNIKPTTPVAIRQTPKHEENGMPIGYYTEPSLDGTREGVFFVNLRDMRSLPKFALPTLLVHEAEPGHHFQFSLQMKGSLPLMRKMARFTAYIEGWALYTEKLAYEHNFFDSVHDKIGHLLDELLRAARLVVDPGIHHKNWSREQAIQYLQQQAGLNPVAAESEAERYFINPGQACSYKLGQLKILELRSLAREAEGANFDIKAFHDNLLQMGACPLTIL